MNVAFTELRRHRWRDVSLDELSDTFEGDFTLQSMADPSTGPEKQTVQRMWMETGGKAITEELTDKQRQALIAVRFHGMPLEEVARRMGTNRNAMYKLLHDARQRLKKRLLEQGLSAQEILAAFE